MMWPNVKLVGGFEPARAGGTGTVSVFVIGAQFTWVAGTRWTTSLLTTGIAGWRTGAAGARSMPARSPATARFPARRCR